MFDCKWYELVFKKGSEPEENVRRYVYVNTKIKINTKL